MASLYEHPATPVAVGCVGSSPLPVASGLLGVDPFLGAAALPFARRYCDPKCCTFTTCPTASYVIT
jgi:hypothetical protein